MSVWRVYPFEELEGRIYVMNGVPDTDHTRVLNTTEYL